MATLAQPCQCNQVLPQKSEEQVLEGGAAASEERWLSGAVLEGDAGEGAQASRVQRFKSMMHVHQIDSEDTGTANF